MMKQPDGSYHEQSPQWIPLSGGLEIASKLNKWLDEGFRPESLS